MITEAIGIGEDVTMTVQDDSGAQVGDSGASPDVASSAVARQLDSEGIIFHRRLQRTEHGASRTINWSKSGSIDPSLEFPKLSNEIDSGSVFQLPTTYNSSENETTQSATKVVVVPMTPIVAGTRPWAEKRKQVSRAKKSY